VNALLIPLNRKNEYNGSTTIDDSKEKFLGDIAASLAPFNTPPANVALLKSLAVDRGDVLRIDTTVASAFPNGRKPADDVVATLLTVIAGAPADDSVGANEKVFETRFPYLALPHQPRDPNADPVLNVDDATRN
jgi:hypothetical protein